jgi:CAAX protease family protein
MEEDDYGSRQFRSVAASKARSHCCARNVFQTYLKDDYALVMVTSVLFGAYHWWTGIGSIVEAVLIGILLMLFYLRAAALWPVVIAHYLTDIVDFAF